MRTVLALTSALLLANVAQADGYYDPTNTASSSGKTAGFELYGTIGCPGTELLDNSCKVEPAKTVAAPAPVTAPVPVAAPAPVVVAAPAPVAAPEKKASAPVASAQAPTYGVYFNPMVYCPVAKK